MKTFNELTVEQKQAAIKHETDSFLKAIIEGAIKFEGGDIQARIDAAWKAAEARQTPWFVGEYIMDTCRADIELMATDSAEETLYTEPGEHVIRGIV